MNAQQLEQYVRGNVWVQRFEQIVSANVWQSVGVFLLIFAAGWWYAAKRGGWGKLAKIYGTKTKWSPIGKGGAYEYSVTIGRSQYEGTWVVPFEEGVLFCYPPLGFLFQSFLIPWRDFKQLNRKTIPILGTTHYQATVTTQSGAHVVGLPHYIVEHKNFPHPKNQTQARR